MDMKDKSFENLLGAFMNYLAADKIKEWIEVGLGEVVYVKIGKPILVRVERGSFGRFSIMLCDFITSNKIPSQWFYKDWLYFCHEMRLAGLFIEEGFWESVEPDVPILGQYLYCGKREPE